jgi:hypothetical protein
VHPRPGSLRLALAMERTRPRLDLLTHRPMGTQD